MCAMTGLNILPSLLWESVSEGQESGLLQRRMSLFKDSKESRYDIESSCKTQVAGAVATLPKRTYSLINLFSYSLHKKAAFTLAEVLITLGIIGVVVALTMPSLIQNYKDKEFITKTKKAYSVIQNAVLLAKSRNEIVDGDNTFLFDPSKTSAQVTQDFAQYFSGAKLCLSKNTNGCKEYYYDVKFATKEGVRSMGSNISKIILNDGTVLSIQQMSSCYRVRNDCVQDSNGNCVTDADGNTTPQTSTHTDCAYIYFDVNGTKLPNQFGRDNYLLKVYTNSIKGSGWAPEGAASLKNILTGKDKLEYTKF